MKQSAARFSALSLSRHGAGLPPGRAFSMASAAHAGELSPYAGPESRVPIFTLKASDGKAHRLEDYRGKVVFGEFLGHLVSPLSGRVAEHAAPGGPDGG